MCFLHLLAANDIPVWFLKKPLCSRYIGLEAKDDATPQFKFESRCMVAVQRSACLFISGTSVLT